MKINNHGYPAGCTHCADIDLFHTVVDRSNSFSLILVLNVLKAILRVFSSIRFMLVSDQLSNRHSVSSLLHAEPRLVFTRRSDNVLIALGLPLIKQYSHNVRS